MNKTRLFFLFCSPLFVLFAIQIKNEVANDYVPIKNQHREQNPGKKAASIYCATCHKLPSPKSLDKATWEKSVLPNMGLRLGLQIDGKKWDADMNPVEAELVRKMNVYPDYPIISDSDWTQIKKYYIENAPESLPSQVFESRSTTTIFPFNSNMVTIGDSHLPQVSLLSFNEITSELYIGDFKNLYVLDNAGRLTKEVKLESHASDLKFDSKGNPLLLTLGKLSPSDQSLGGLSRITGKPEIKDEASLMTGLKRPVNFEIEDLNNDGREDLIVCSFGHFGGKLSWFDNFELSKEHVLNTLPGTRKVEISDFNKDGKPDLMALMTQAKEQINIYYNKGDNTFEENTVLSFDAVNGTSYFELADFNNDGHQDILVTNGDNRDFSPIDKPYHGIRIYLNNGNNQFKESFFYPMYDCGKAMARDFDNDGDIDIVGASLYSEYTDKRNAKQSVVFLQNDGELNFNASYMPTPIHGNWLTMEVGDFNNDDYLDVMLGTFIYSIPEMMSVSMNTGITSFPQVLLLTYIP